MAVLRLRPADTLAELMLRAAHALPWLMHGRVRGRFIRWLRARQVEMGEIMVQGAPCRLYLDSIADAKFLVTPRTYQQAEFRFLQRALGKPGAVFVDIGANTGLFSFVASRAMPADGRILCIEPNPAMAPRIRAHLPTWPGLEILLCAVGETEAEAVLDLSLGAGSAHLSGAVASAAHSIAVPVRPLPVLLQEAGVERVDALKIDVEGWEDRALGGLFGDASLMALWPQAVVIEHCHRDRWQTDVLALMAHCGYRVEGQNRNNTLLIRGPASQ